MKTNEQNITKRILIPLGLTLLILLTTSIVSIYWLQRLHLNEEVEEHLKEVEQLFQMKLDEEAKALLSQINLLQMNKELQNAYRTKDRETLLRHAMPFFQTIHAKYQVTHFYFIELDKVCFLRVHNPPRYGDTIPRFTLADAIRQDTPVYGIELGKFGTFTLRVVSPWRVDGELIGYLELGKEIEHLTVALKKILNVELFFTIDKSYLNRADWQEGLKMMGRTGDWAQFRHVVVIDKTMPAIPPELKESLDKPSLQAKHDYLAAILQLSVGDKQYRGGFVPLIDAGNRKLGEIIVLNDVSEQETALRTLSIILITISVIIGGALLGFFYLFIGCIESKLIKVHTDLIAAEKSQNKLAKEKIQQQTEFLRIVIDSLDHPFYIINANNYQIDIANSATSSLGLWPSATCHALTHNRSEPCTGANEPCPLKEIRNTKKPVVVEHIHFDKAGNPRHFEVHGFPIFDQQGNITQMIEYSLDITERKRAEQEIARLNERLKAENLRMSAELDVTRRLQQMLLPKPHELNQINGLEIADFLQAAEEVGGDYYDVLVHDGRVRIGIGDVTGHGLESGVLAIMVQTAVRTLLDSHETDLVKILNTINRTIYDNVQRMNSDKNLTLALLDYHHGQIILSGQHEEMIVVRQGKVERIDTIDLGFPIGLEPDIVNFTAITKVTLNPGDVVVLYTDGITEAENSDGKLYRLERLCEIIRQNWQKSAEEIRQAVIDDVRQYIGQHKVFDDITLLVLKQK
jgi:serine phosphatase RsbU (regulator of sigma subunit)/PAS domain-containing protein